MAKPAQARGKKPPRKPSINPIVGAAQGKGGIFSGVKNLVAEANAEARIQALQMNSTLEEKGCVKCVLKSFGFQPVETIVGAPQRPRERMATMQTLQDPIMLVSWVCFQGGGFPKTTDGWRNVRAG